MFLTALKESRRGWFKRSLDFRERKKVASIRPGDGWDWQKGFDHQIEKVRTEAKKLSKRLAYTIDSEYADSVKAAKQAWYAENKPKP